MDNLTHCLIGGALGAALAPAKHRRAAVLAGALLNNLPDLDVLLWRVVAMTPDGFVEGERSLVADAGPMRFRHYVSDTAALAAVSHYPSVQRLQWFTHGFLKAERRDGKLVLSDLRMGSEPDYSFRFEVARASAAGWQPQPVEQLKWPWEATRRLPDMWRRIWNAPVARAGSHPPASSAP